MDVVLWISSVLNYSARLHNCCQCNQFTLRFLYVRHAAVNAAHVYGVQLVSK